MKKIRVNIVSESDVSVQGHGVHTAYIEQAAALEKRDDITLIRGRFNKWLPVDIVHLHTIGPRVWRKLLQPHAKKVISAHVVPASLVGSIALAKYWLPLANFYMRWFYNRGDKVLAVSKTVANVLHRDLHVPKEKIEVVYNTIDMSRYHGTNQEKLSAKKALGFKEDTFIVLGNGQVQPRKRLDVFVRMAKEQPDIQFVWVGGIPFKQLGADYAAMRRLMENVPPNLRVTGVIPHTKVRDYLLSADVFCLPAEQENHPMCVLEAAGAGLPIILRDLPEYDDTFKNDVVRCKDGEFTRAVKKLRSDKAFYALQKQKTKLIAERFDSAYGGEQLAQIYRHLI